MCNISVEDLDVMKRLSELENKINNISNIEINTDNTLEYFEIIKEAFTGLGHIKQFDESYIASSQDKYACEIRVVCPPEGKDPDEFIRTVGADTFKQIIEASPLLIDFKLNNLLKNKNQAGYYSNYFNSMITLLYGS